MEAGRDRLGAAAGVAAVVLFAVAAVLTGGRPDFDAPGSEVAAWYGDERTSIQVGCLLLALVGALLVWFLASVAGLASEHGPAAGRVGLLMLALGLVFVALFMADVTTLAIGALRPENMAVEPDLAATLQDFELIAMAIAAPMAAGTLAAAAVLVLRFGAVWPRRIGQLAAVAAPLYALRTGTLFTTDGPFAADGVIGSWIPVLAIASWILAAALTLAVSGPRSSAAAP